MAEPVEGDGDDDDHTDNDLLDVGRPAHLLGAAAQEGHDQRADDRAQDRPFPAGKAGAADHDGGDHIQFFAHVYRRVTLP